MEEKTRNNLIKGFTQVIPEANILKDEKLSKRTTFKTGGPASLFVIADDEEALKTVLLACDEMKVKHFLIGNGSNLLAKDEGFDGVIIKLGSGFSKLSVVDEINEGTGLITAGAGVMLTQLSLYALKKGFTGLEFAHGIPGTVGGAVFMNAGAYGGEMKMITESVTLLSPEGDIVTYDNEAMEFGYRTSSIKNKGYVVLETALSLEKGDSEQIIATMNELALKRKEKQPLEYPSAGSTFKRPEGYFAGKLIEDAGLRGYQVGGARVSDKHCGFVVNMGDATSTDVYRLICDVREKVLKESGVTLEPEVIMLGDF
jgi:UDP-N-acetylmuramate dehydrogenase